MIKQKFVLGLATSNNIYAITTKCYAFSIKIDSRLNLDLGFSQLIFWKYLDQH